VAALRDDAHGRGRVRIGVRVRELEIAPDPGDPSVVAAIARALERLEHEEGFTAAAPHERSAWAAEARRELVDDGLA
jgi:hypothetical protein